MISPRYTEIFISSNDPMYLFGFISIALLFTLAFRLYIKSKIFTAGAQYKWVVRSLGRENVQKINKKKKKLGNFKNLINEEKKRENRKKMELSLLRIRWNMKIEDFNKVTFFEFLISTAFTIILAPFILSFGGIVSTIGPLGLILMPLWGLSHNSMKYSKTLKELTNDIDKDVVRMVSLYKNSTDVGGFPVLVDNYLPTANAIKKDLQLYISDLNSYPEGEALDLLAGRVGTPSMHRLASYIKSSATATRSQFEANLNILDVELSNALKEKTQKNLKSRFTQIMFTLIPLFAFFALIMMTGEIVEIRNALIFEL